MIGQVLHVWDSCFSPAACSETKSTDWFCSELCDPASWGLGYTRYKKSLCNTAGCPNCVLCQVLFWAVRKARQNWLWDRFSHTVVSGLKYSKWVQWRIEGQEKHLVLMILQIATWTCADFYFNYFNHLQRPCNSLTNLSISKCSPMFTVKVGLK